MPDCRGVEVLLSAHLDGELPAPDQRVVDAHLAVCEACRAEQARLAELRSLLRSLPARRAPHGLTWQLHRAAARDRSRQRARRGLTVAAVAVALTTGAFVGADDDPDPSDTSARASIDDLVSEHLSVIDAPEEATAP